MALPARTACRYTRGQRALQPRPPAHGVCEELGPQPTALIPAGHVLVDVPPTELRVEDQVLTGGRLSVMTGLRRHCFMVLGNGRVAVAHRTVRVYRSRGPARLDGP
ncbi:hypothetical protein [Streptomyces sp. A1136]|uniref:hypothetical protein n=1 Tax=Streptomyces sp. A1136 TaxID=2563102 RepID=UPI00109EA6BE|nr:hypothetical protein [Streptomyces sp. A1136]THA48343.1 hypothetical protein E6R62_29230 [Streptomyces sp. A1136]